MHYLATVIAAIVLAGCSATHVTRSESQSASSTQALAAEPQKASLDSALQFLLTAAAKDFHTHGPSDSLRFRNVRIGHITTSDGTVQYRLCGQFLPLQKDGNAEWIPFATIKMSDYEQWIGDTSWCQESEVTWDKVDDLSSLLQSRYDSLR